MGANAQTSVPTFTAGDVLTAANMNISARTGVPVFATTVTRDAAFGGTGEKTLAEGQMCYVESTGFQTYNGTSWVTWGTAPSTGGLELISSTTIGSAVSTVTVSNVFSATYYNYRIVVSNVDCSVANQAMRFQLGSTTTAYYGAVRAIPFLGADTTTTTDNGASLGIMLSDEDDDTNGFFDVTGPFASVTTGLVGLGATQARIQIFGGQQQSSTSFTAFTIFPASGTMTGGTIKVYGYKN